MALTAIAPKRKNNLPPPGSGGTRAAVPYKIVKNPLPEDSYESPRKKMPSPYRDALTSLASAPRGSVIEFADVKALSRVRPVAKKLGYTIHVAENAGKLYVQIVDTGEDK